MTPKQFKTARLALGLTVAELAKIIDTDPRTVRRWESDPSLSTSRPPNPIACKVMEWMTDGIILPPKS